jgi:hypothetical protein
MSCQLSTLSDELFYSSQEQGINSDIFFSLTSQADETSEFDEKVYYHENTNSSQSSQKSQYIQKTKETNLKSKEMFAIEKEDFLKRHTHKKDDKDNILRKITNQISKTGINKTNELIQKNTTKKYRLNIVSYKGKFNQKDYPINFLNQTLKNFFSQIPNNKIIIDELIQENHTIAEFLDQKFEDYIESEDVSNDFIKVKKKLSLTNEQTYIDKFEQYWKNLKEIINKTLKREIKK